MSGGARGAIHAPFSARPRLTREDVLGGREVADLLDLPVSTVLEYARRGLLPGHKLGRRWIFLRDEVEAAVRARHRWGEGFQGSVRVVAHGAPGLPRDPEDHQADHEADDRVGDRQARGDHER
jgi:excisionase family DNA binding protein